MIWTEAQSEEFLRKQLPIAKTTITENTKQAASAAKKYGYPCVIKISSPSIIHKTEINGVKIVHTEKELQEAAKTLLNIAKKIKAKNPKIIVQEYIKGLEFIIGIQKDPTFGHVIMAGLGGIYVEIFKDVTFRAAPITKKEAKKMIQELKSSKIFNTRGKKYNVDSFAELISKVSQIPTKHPTIKSLDLNPVMITPKKTTIVDARIEWQK